MSVHSTQQAPASSPTTTGSNQTIPHNQIVRAQDSLVPMQTKKTGWLETIKRFVTTPCGKLYNVMTTIWNLITWPFRAKERTSIETVDAIIKDPKEAATNARDNPIESLCNVMMAVIKNPVAVGTKCRQNNAKIGSFVQMFKATIKDPTALVQGKNGIFKTFTDLLGIFTGQGPKWKADHILVKYCIERPNLFSGAIKIYCKQVLDTLGEKEGELESIKTALHFFDRFANQITKDPAQFKSLVENIFLQEEFGIADVAFWTRLALQDNEKAALLACGKGDHQVLKRLNTAPQLLNPQLRNAKIGLGAVHTAILQQFTPKDFTDLGKVIKNDYPLGAAVCNQLADFAKKDPQLFKKACANYDSIIRVIQYIWNQPAPKE